MKKQYTNDLKKQVVERYLKGEPVAELSAELGIAKSSIYEWISELNSYTAEQAKIMRSKLNKQQQIIEILKSVNCTVSSPLKQKLTELEKLYGQYDNHTLCEALDVDRATFLNHIKRRKGDDAWFVQRRTDLREIIQEIYDDSNGIYGAEKIAALIKKRGISVSDRLVRELMKELGLKSLRQNAKKEYLKERCKQNILRQNFHADKPNEIWSGDVTAFKYNNKWYYVCVVLDLFSRKIIAHGISRNNSTHLIKSTMKRAIVSRQCSTGIIFHSDNGANYTSYAFEMYLKQNEITHSYSRARNSKDNAVTETFFSSLKLEKLYRITLKSEKEFYNAIADHINFYNSERPHSTLKYMTPDEFENKYYKNREETNPE